MTAILQSMTTPDAAPSGQRRTLGIETLDSLLHGGLPDGNALLVQGAPGTGKTALGMQFLHEGATRLDEPGLLVTFEEHPERLLRDARAFGWDFERLERDGRLLLVFTSPAVFLKELESDHYGRMAREYGLKRIVIDNLTQFEMIPQAADDVRARFERVVNALRRDRLLTFLTREVETREPIVFVTPEEYIADTVIQLEYRLAGERRARLIEVLKHRGSSHSSSQHRFVIAEGGLQILAETDANG